MREELTAMVGPACTTGYYAYIDERATGQGDAPRASRASKKR